MPRMDDYIAARRLAVEKLSQIPFADLAQKTGFDTPAENGFQLTFLDQIYTIGYPGFEFVNQTAPEAEVPIQEQVLILHYMTGAVPVEASEERIAYREIKGASFYFSAFVKRAIDPLKKVFGQNPQGFTAAAEKLDATKVPFGDAGFEFAVFPYVSVQMILWTGDEEFPAEANILFEPSIEEMLSPEDVAWLAGMIVYRLIRLAAS